MVKMMFSFFWKGCLDFGGGSCYMSFRYIIVRCHSNVVLFEVMNSYTQLVSFGLLLKLIYLYLGQFKTTSAEVIPNGGLVRP